MSEHENPDPTPAEPSPPPRPTAVTPPISVPPPSPGAWYSGPYPPPGTGAREGTWRMIWRTGTKATIAGGCFGASLVFFLFVPLIVIIAIIAAASDGGDDTDFVFGDEDSGNRLLSIPVQGIILGEEPDETSLFGNPGVVYGYEIKEKLRKAAEDDDIRGVILEFETPGGTIFGSQAIADGIRDYQAATGKPVLAFVAGLSASGGMYGMAPADLILADHGSLLGSIGVTMGAFEYWDELIATEGGLFGGGVTTANGIEFEPITAGRSKDVGAPYRRLTTEERAVLQKAVDDIYDDFVAHVSQARNIPEAKIRNEIGALVYSNEQAQVLGLIDGTANRQQAYQRAADLAGLSGKRWQVVRDTGNDALFGGLFGRSEKSKPAEAQPTRICFPAHAVLAYYGNPLALCAGK